MRPTLPLHAAGRLGAALALALLTPGCLTRPWSDMVIGESYQPANIYLRDRTLPPGFRRVAVLPIARLADTGELTQGQQALQPVLLAELAQARRFEVVALSPAELASSTGREQWQAAEPLPPSLLATVRERYNCDGLLFPEVTQFHPYPPLVVGWKLKLAETRTGQILWAADEVFDASVAPVQNGARRYQLNHTQLSGSLVDSKFILLTPTAFGHYATEAVLATLPPVETAKVSWSSADK